MLQIIKSENGNLELSIPNQEDRQELKGLYYHSDGSTNDLSTYDSLFEKFSCNGSYTVIGSELIPVGLTSDPYIVVDTLDCNDNGTYTVYGGMYHYPQYQTSSVVERLIQGETVTLVCFDKCPTKGRIYKPFN